MAKLVSYAKCFYSVVLIHLSYFEINVREGITPLVSCMVSMFLLIQKFRNRERQRGKTTSNSNDFLFP